ncbi:MAG: hypothetical protein H7834_15590, partial [Magnetococcus sp. YQC-9]
RALEKEASKAKVALDETPQEEMVEANPTAGKRRKDPMIVSIEGRLMDTLGVQVSITHLRGKGKVIVEYGTLEQLESLADRLLKYQE